MSVFSRLKLDAYGWFYLCVGLIFVVIMALPAAEADDPSQIRVCVESRSTALHDATTDRLYYNGYLVVGCNEQHDIRVVAVKSEDRPSQNTTRVSAQFHFFRYGESGAYDAFSVSSEPYYRWADYSDRIVAATAQIHQMVDQREHRFRIAIGA